MPTIRFEAGGRARYPLVIATVIATLLLSKSSGQQQLYVDRPPVSATVFLGRNATFHCTSVSSSSILWLMNQTLIHRLPKEYNASSVGTRRTDGIAGGNSTLTVLGSEATNGTQYRCGVLDQRTNSIVNYSAPVILKVQGKPLPPTGLQVLITKELEAYIIRLNWMRSRSLFDEIDGSMRQPSYIVYAHLGLNSSTASLRYQNETASLSHNITLKNLNVSACNLSAVSFYVSAKFDEVGEGNVSSPVNIRDSVAADICRAESLNKPGTEGLSTRNDDNSKIIAGSIVGVVLLITIIIVVSLIGCWMLYKHAKGTQSSNGQESNPTQKKLKLELSNNEAYGVWNSNSKTNEMINVTKSASPMEDQHLYEHVTDNVVTDHETAVVPVEGSRVTHTNQVYESVTDITNHKQ